MTISGLLALLLLAYAAPTRAPLAPEALSLQARFPALPAADWLQPLNCPEDTKEFVPDGDFGSSTDPYLEDDPGYSPDLTFFATPPLTPGSYAISSGTDAWGDPADEGWITLSADADNDPNGYMMLVSPSGDRPDTLLQRTIALCPSGGEFEFTIQLRNIAASAGGVEPNLQLLVGDRTIPLGPIQQGADWRRVLVRFPDIGIGPDPVIPVSLINIATGADVDDFVIDNISVTTCVPFLDAQSNTTNVCPGESVSLSATIGTNPTLNPAYFQWQVSVNGSPFENVGNPTTDLTLDVAAVPPFARYRVLAGTDPALLADGTCSIASDPVAIDYGNIENCYAGEVITNITDELCGGKLGANLVEGGDFGMGQDTLGPALDAGVTTLEHNPVDSFPQRPGQYVVAGVLNADPCEGAYAEPCWTSFERDTIDSTGFRMVIDANEKPDIFFQGVVDSLCENTTYQFSLEVLNLAAAFFDPDSSDPDSTVALPNIDLVVAPVGTPTEVLQAMPAAYNSGDIPNDTSLTTVGFTFEMAPGQSDILIAVRNNGPGGFGNDLAIDNVRVSVCGPPSRATYTMTCPDPGSLTFTAEIDNQNQEMGPDPAIRWFRLDENGEPEALQPEENGPTITRVDIAEGNAFGFYVARTAAELDFPNCRIESDPAVISYLPVPIDSIQRAICIGESITIDGETYDQTGVYNILFEDGSVDGCDSILVLDLQVADPIQVSISEAICPGETITVGDQVFGFDDIGAPIEVTLQAQGGCDSIVTLNLFQREILLATSETICEGDSVELNGTFYSTTGIYRDTIPAFQLGCDTIFELDLTVLDAPRREETVSLCPGDSYMGEVYFSDTTLTERVPAPSGCDSLITINLDLGPLGGFAIQGSTILCGSGPITLDATTENATFLWSTGATTPTISVDSPGSYSVEVVSGTCTARDTVEVRVGDMELTLNAIDPFCAGEDSGSIEVSRVNGGQEPYSYILNDDGNPQSSPLFTGLSAGTYTITVNGSGGCTVTETVTLDEPEPFTIQLEPVINLPAGQSVQLQPVVSSPPSAGAWSPSEGLSCTACLNPVASPFITTIYTLSLFDANGCPATAEVQIIVDGSLPIYAPNAFSPNGDGNNDFFTIYANQRVQQIDRLIVFDRWGNKVFERSPLPINDEAQGWNGRFNGTDSPVGVYVFFAEITLVDNTTETIQGDVTLLR